MLHRPNRGSLLLLFSVALTSLIALAPAATAACPGVDPQCVIETIAPPPTSLPGTDPVTENVPAPVQDAVDTAKGTAGAVVDKVKDTVDGVLNPGKGGGGGGPGGGGSGGGTNGGKVPSTQGTSGPVVGPGLNPTPLSGRPLNGPALSSSAGSPSLVDRIGRGAVETAKQLGFPLVLALMVIAFLIIQDRLDRRDPKLALAPITPDVSRFA